MKPIFQMVATQLVLLAWGIGAWKFKDTTLADLPPGNSVAINFGLSCVFLPILLAAIGLSIALIGGVVGLIIGGLWLVSGEVYTFFTDFILGKKPEGEVNEP